MYPGEVHQRDPDDPGYWLSLTEGSITRMVHMPQRAQKVLSKPVNVMMAKRAQAEWVGDETLGSVERRERAEETTCTASGDVLRAHWRQRIGVEIMRGVARCIQRSADSSSMATTVSSRRRNLEYDRHCC